MSDKESGRNGDWLRAGLDKIDQRDKLIDFRYHGFGYTNDWGLVG